MQIWKPTYEHISEDFFLLAIIAVAIMATINAMAAFWHPVRTMSSNSLSSVKACGAELLTHSSSGQSPHLKPDSSDFGVPALQICSQRLVLLVRCLVWLSWLWNEGTFRTSLRGREPGFLQERHPCRDPRAHLGPGWHPNERMGPIVTLILFFRCQPRLWT